MSKVREVHVEDQVEKDYYEYGVHVNEERSVPGKIDGLKPVARRILWAAFKMGSTSGSKTVKAARIVGDTLGKYHPHGDSSVFSAMVTLVNSPVPLISGQGNWGNISEQKAAAMRYVEARLHKHAEKMFFDRFYLPAIDFIPNYDGSEKEPLNLPALLPNVLLNGSFGIGVGVSTNVPSFTPESVVNVLTEYLNGAELDYKLCRKLEFTTQYGGHAVRDKAEEKVLHTTGKGRITFRSLQTYDSKKNSLIYTAFAPVTSLEKVLDKCALLPEVAKPNDISGKKDKYGTVRVAFRKNLKGKALDSAIEKVENVFSADESYDIKVTNRFIDDKGKPHSKLTNSTVPSILKEWVEYRIELEKKACAHWIGKSQEVIAYLNLMRIAVANRALIIKALDRKCSEQELAEHLAKQLKITVAEANLILDIKVRQLRALEDESLVKRIKDEEAHVKVLSERKAKPKPYISLQLKELVKSVAN